MANHISHASLPYPVKGARYTVLVPYLDADGDPTDPTTPDTEVSVDAAAFADAAEEVTTITGSNGFGYVTLTGAETNGSAIAVAFKVASGPKASVMTLQPRVLPVMASGTASAGAAGSITVGLAYDIRGAIIKTTGGTGGGGTGGANNQARVVTAYNTGTGVATVVPNWETTPDNTTTYEVLGTDMMTVSASARATSLAADVITSASITDGAFTAAKFAASSLNGKGDWNVGKTGYSLTATTGLGNQTANITGNLSGSVGSVTGSVGSVVGLTASDVGAIKTKTDFLPSATAGAAGGLLIAGSNAATTFATWTVTGVAIYTGNVSMAAGLTITQSTLDGNGITVTGNGAGVGFSISGGTGMLLVSTAGNAFEITATGGDGVQIAGDGNGVQIVGLGSDPALYVTGVSGNSLTLEGPVSLTSTLDVVGAATLATIATGGVTVEDLNVSGDVTIAGALVSGTNGIPWNAAWDAEVQSEVDDGLIEKGLDHLVFTSVVGGDIADNSIVAKLASKSATADWDSFVNTTDSLEAIRDNAGGGGGLTQQDVRDAMKLDATAGAPAAGSVDKHLDDILTNTSALSGSGAYVVTITVNDGAVALQNALVRMTEGVNTFTAATNVSGVATFSLDNATYTISITKAGYSFTPTTQVVSGTTSATKSMTAITFSGAPSDPDRCLVYGYLRSQSSGSVLAGVKLVARRYPDELAYAGGFLVGTYKEATSDVNGLVELELERTDVITPSGAKWVIECVDAGLRYKTTLTTATFDLSTII